MTNKVKVILFGIGAIGSHIARFAFTLNGLRLIDRPLLAPSSLRKREKRYLCPRLMGKR